MQQLGKKIIENLNEEVVHGIFMDTDFKERTVLHLITTMGYVPLLSDEKTSVLLEELWEGKATYECDGKTSYHSKLTFLASNSIANLPGKPVTFKQLLGNSFERKIQQEAFAE